MLDTLGKINSHFILQKKNVIQKIISKKVIEKCFASIVFNKKSQDILVENCKKC